METLAVAWRVAFVIGLLETVAGAGGAAAMLVMGDAPRAALLAFVGLQVGWVTYIIRPRGG